MLRVLFCLLLLLSTACGDPTQARQLGSDAGDGDRSDSESDGDGDDQDADGNQDERGPTSSECTRGGEFDECPDAATIKPRDSGAPPLKDAGPVKDAGPDPQPDPAASTPEGPCGMKQRGCSNAYYEAKSDNAQCQLLNKDRLRVRYNICETCGIAGGFIGPDVVVTGCGTCGQVYREGYSDEYTTQANGCGIVDISAYLAGTAVADDCIDVYGVANSWKDSHTTGEQQARICRCSRKDLTCTSCADGACD